MKKISRECLRDIFPDFEGLLWGAEKDGDGSVSHTYECAECNSIHKLQCESDSNENNLRQAVLEGLNVPDDLEEKNIYMVPKRWASSFKKDLEKRLAINTKESSGVKRTKSTSSKELSKITASPRDPIDDRTVTGLIRCPHGRLVPGHPGPQAVPMTLTGWTALKELFGAVRLMLTPFFGPAS